jgi:hypothetical protein
MAQTLFDTTMRKANAQADPRADAWINHANNMNSRAAQRHHQRNAGKQHSNHSNSYDTRSSPQARNYTHPRPQQSRQAVTPRKPGTYSHAEIGQYQIPTGTLPYAYAPSGLARKENGRVVRGWRIPDWKEVLKDLGFLILETALAAIGSAIFAFFTGHRRFHPGPGVLR